MFLAAPALLALSHLDGICPVPRSLEENKSLHTPGHSTPPAAEEACCHQCGLRLPQSGTVEGDLENHGEERSFRLCGRTGTSWSPGLARGPSPQSL